MDGAAPVAASPVLLSEMNKANKVKCRACLSVNRDTIKLDANIPDLQHPRTYAQSFRLCTGLAVNMSNSGAYKWPLQMCMRCCRALEIAMHFVEMAVKSDRVLNDEALKAKSLVKSESELKRKASIEVVRWNQFSQKFEQFVESYDGTTAPIEENVVYMRGAKIPRLDVDATALNEPPQEDDVIIFDVKYDTNIDVEDENDGSDAKNSETFFDTSIISTINTANTDSKSSENNNNYNFNNKNGDLSSLPDIEGELIQRALFMTLNDTSQTTDDLDKIESIKATLLESSENLIAKTDVLITAPIQEPSASNASTLKTDNSNIPLLSCNMCKYNNIDAKLLRNHYMRVHKCDISEDEIIGLTKNQMFKCRPCNRFETKSRNEMQRHLIDHHKIDGDFEMYCYEQQNCPACLRVFKDQRSARTHYTRMHTSPSGSSSGSELHICQYCNKSFNQKASLQSHQRFCQISHPVHCTFCKEEFSTMRKYETHLQEKHAVDTVHECEICHKTFKNADSLTMHRKRHTERHHQCEKCSLNYVNAAELKVHYERTHVHEQQISCGSCGTQFQNHALLREHIQRNHQQKIWRCDKCTYETTSRARLRQHQYEHTGNPYKCKQCQDEFTDRGKIRQHSKRMHGIELSDTELAEMFRERVGYTNRFDAFSKANNSLEIPGFFNDDCLSELKSLGVDYDDISTNLFTTSSSTLDNLLDLLP